MEIKSIIENLPYKIKDIIKIITNNWNQKFHTKFKPIFKGQDFTNGTFRSGSNNKAKKMFNWNTIGFSIQPSISSILEPGSEIKKSK